MLFRSKQDLPGQIRRLADFLDIEVDESRWEQLVEHCSFDWMKANAHKTVPLGGAFWDAGPKVFIHRGVNGRWHDRLSEAQSRAYEERAVAELGEACASWLAGEST